jgi:hypothetical protein
MADPVTRQQIRRGLLKSEEMHALARQVGWENIILYGEYVRDRSLVRG